MPDLEKRVDGDWKRRAQQEKEQISAKTKVEGTAAPAADAKPSQAFLSLVSQLTQQAAYYLGMVDDPQIGHVPAEVRPPLMLVGDHPDPGEIAYLRQLATACGVALTIRARVPEEALRDLYARARLFLYAPYLEPLGLAALEAMACGTPVLGVREGGVRETVLDGSTGRLVERHLTGFAAALEELLADPGALEAMGRQAREYVRREWTWERSVGRLLRLFDEALVGRAEPPL